MKGQKRVLFLLRQITRNEARATSRATHVEMLIGGQVERHIGRPRFRTGVVIGSRSTDRFTSAYGDVALEMHLRTIGEPEHGEQCRIRQPCVSIVDEFRHHLSLYGTPLSWKTEQGLRNSILSRSAE